MVKNSNSKIVRDVASKLQLKMEFVQDVTQTITITKKNRRQETMVNKEYYEDWLSDNKDEMLQEFVEENDDAWQLFLSNKFQDYLDGKDI